MSLLQPYIEGQSEPHPIVMMSDHIFAFIGLDQDTMHIEESLSQPDREEFYYVNEKGIIRSH